MSKIEWTEATWNIVTGCAKVSPGCKNCYAEVMSHRLRQMRGAAGDKYRNGFEVTLHPKDLMKPYRWRKPRTVFVCSMSDLFHDEVPAGYIARAFRVMKENQRHIFQVLTKRPQRVLELQQRGQIEWPENIWFGVSAENNEWLMNRWEYLRQIDSKTKFLSCEPLLGELNDLGQVIEGIDWVIVGGESGIGYRGGKARYMRPAWARQIRDVCKTAEVPFFFKQWGGIRKHTTGRLLDGVEYNEMPNG